MSVVFSKPDKRTLWEESIADAKQKLVASFDRFPAPLFINSVPIRKTRAGLQFTCASPTKDGLVEEYKISDDFVKEIAVYKSVLPSLTIILKKIGEKVEFTPK